MALAMKRKEHIQKKLVDADQAGKRKLKKGKDLMLRPQDEAAGARCASFIRSLLFTDCALHLAATEDVQMNLALTSRELSMLVRADKHDHNPNRDKLFNGDTR